MHDRVQHVMHIYFWLKLLERCKTPRRLRIRLVEGPENNHNSRSSPAALTPVRYSTPTTTRGIIVMENDPAQPIIEYDDLVHRATSALAVTRVMSPNTQSNMFGVQWWTCPLCQSASRGEPAVCASCGRWGHTQCVEIEQFQGHPVCSGCIRQCCV